MNTKHIEDHASALASLEMELICAAPRMLEALQIAKTEFEARDGAGTCPLEIEDLLEELSQHNDLGQPPATGGEADTHHQPLK